MKKIGIRFAVFLALAAVLLAGCGAASKPVVVGSKIDTEGGLLGSMMVQMLQQAKIPVTDKTQTGTTPVVRKAIMNGEIDLYPEYTGNGGFFFDGQDPTVWKDAQKGWALVKQLDYDKNKLVWLDPAPANNTWAVAVNKTLAEGSKLKTFDDFANYVKKGGKVKIVGSEEFFSRPDAFPAFEQAYGFTLSKAQIVSLSGGDTAATEKAASEGTDGVNVAMAYGTDGALAALGLTVLEDSKGIQPVYQPAPLIREEVLKAYPQIADLLKPVFASLDLVTLQTLNSQIAKDGKNAGDIASAYLKSKGFLK